MSQKQGWFSKIFGRKDKASITEDSAAATRIELRASANVPTTFEAGATVIAYPDSPDAGEGHEAGDAVAAVWSPGDVILGLYEVKGILGEGGMGTVYQVRHRDWNTDLAVKSPKAEELAKAGGAENFVRECETWVNLGLHPHIVSCFYVRTLGGIPRVFAEYVEGGSLSDWIRTRKLYEGGPEKALERILDIAIQFAWGLDYAHEQGLIHQDVKPANVMMTPEGIVKVTDFGLARARGRAATPGEATSGATLMAASGGMTPAYASPEQARGEALTRRTDIWSWGVSLLEMFTGEVTWLSGQAAPGALQGYLEAGADNSALPKMPKSIAELLTNCFAEDPQRRPPSVKKIVTHLKDTFETLTAALYARPEPTLAQLTADALNNRAVSLLDLGKTEEAAAAWTKAISFDPLHVESIYNSGTVRWRGGEDPNDSLISKLQPIADRRESAHARHLLALAHLERGTANAGAALLRDIAPRAPSSADFELEIATALSWSDHIPIVRSLGHPFSVISLALSSDGCWVLTAAADAILRLWGAASGACNRTFEGTSEQSSIAEGSAATGAATLTADGTYAAFGRGKKVVLWELASTRRLRTLDHDESRVIAVAFSRDGHSLLSASRDGTLRVWDVATGTCSRVMETKAPIASAAVAPTFSHAAAGLDDGTICVWDVRTGARVSAFRDHDGSVEAMAFAPDETLRILTAGYDCKVRIWDSRTNRCLRVFEGHSSLVSAVCWSPNREWVLSGASDRTLRLWDVQTARCIGVLRGHTGEVTCVCISSDGRRAFSGGRDDTVRLWELPDPRLYPLRLSHPVLYEQLLSVHNHLAALHTEIDERLGAGRISEALDIAREARRTTGYERHPENVERWQRLTMLLPRVGLRAAWLRWRLSGHENGVSSIVLSDDNHYAISGGVDGSVFAWDLASGVNLGVIPKALDGHQVQRVGICRRSPSLVVACASGGLLELWNIRDSVNIASLRGPRSDHWIWTMLPSNLELIDVDDHRDVVLAGLERGVELNVHRPGHEIPRGVLRRRPWIYHSDVFDAYLSADERFAISAHQDSHLRLWNLATNDLVHTFRGHSDCALCVGLTKDGKLAVSGGGEGTVRVWDMATGHCLRVLTGHSAPVRAVTLTFDGRFAISGSDDKTLRCWDILSGECAWVFEGHPSPITSACITRNGECLISGSQDGTLRVWSLDWELEGQEPTWNPSIQDYLRTFLTLHTPLPSPRSRSETEGLAIEQWGPPSWTQGDFQDLLLQMGCAGYGYIPAADIEAALGQESRAWPGPPPLPLAELRELRQRLVVALRVRLHTLLLRARLVRILGLRLACLTQGDRSAEARRNEFPNVDQT